MYGKWFLSVFGLGAVILLIVALMTAFSALAAVAIGLFVGSMVMWVLAAGRTRQVGAERETSAEERRQAGQTEFSAASGAPQSGEGDAGAAQRVRLRGS